MNYPVELSIIIPVFNGEMYINKLVENILNENIDIIDLFEIILVNDGSRDKSETVCKDISNKYSNIKYILQNNSGIASARNKGIEISTGKYVTFIDQDDALKSGYSTFLEIMELNDLDILYTSYWSRQNISEKCYFRKLDDFILSEKEEIINLATSLIDHKYLSKKGTPLIPSTVWNCIYRSEMVYNNKIRFKRFIDYEDDWIFNIEALINSNKIGITHKGYYCWNIHVDSESHRKKYIQNLLEKRIDWMSWLTDILERLGIDELTKEEFINYIINPRNIVIVFKNEFGADNLRFDELRNLTSVALSTWKMKKMSVNDVKGMSRKDKFLFLLLKNKKLKLAYLVNKYILKTTYH